MKRRLLKKRVSWPSDVNLCQIRMFLSDEAPSQVGLNSQAHLQAKASWMLHSNGMGSDDNLPPGFEIAHPANELNNMVSKIPVIKWKCPSKVLLNADWQVVSGDESLDAKLQTRREMRVLEAIYPRQSAIPLNPVFPMEMEDPRHIDRQIPMIPITAIEDEESPGDSSYDSVEPLNLPYSGGSSVSSPKMEESVTGTALDVEPDIAIAVSAAFTAIMKTNEQGSMIDQDLLIQILNNPKLLEKLVTEYGVAPINPQSSSSPNLLPINSYGPALTQINRIETAGSDYVPSTIPKTTGMSNLSTVNLSGSAHAQLNRMEKMITDYGAATHTQTSATPNVSPVGLSGPAHLQINRIETGGSTSLSAPNSSKPYYSKDTMPFPVAPPPPPPPRVVTAASQPSVAAPKDLNYYKNLIQQHGGERHNNHKTGANQESAMNLKPSDLKPKMIKRCIYFNSSKGCRRGASCSFSHDGSFHEGVSSFPDAQSTKRMKFDTEIKGR